MTDRENFIDIARSACLYDAGLPGYFAVVAIGADGTDHLVLARRDGIGGGDGDGYDPRCRRVSHEQLGRLPRALQERIWGDALRCGRPTTKGRPCQAAVAEPGRPCRQHRQGDSE